MARITIELSDDLKAAFACTEAEQQLAETLADLAFSEAKPGVRPLVYIELAARILAETADMAIATQTRAGGPQIDRQAGASAMLSYVFERAMELIAAPNKIT